MSEKRPRAVAVEPLEAYRLLVTFDNQEKRVFDVLPYIRGSWFGRLKDPKVFNAVRVGGLSIQWPDGQDICPDELYFCSAPEGNGAGAAADTADIRRARAE